MNSTCERQNDDWELLALGALDDAAATPLRAHLQSGCTVCKLVYTQALTANLALSASVALAEPGEAVEQRLAAYAGVRPRRKAARNYWYPALAAAAALAIAVWMGSGKVETLPPPASPSAPAAQDFGPQKRRLEQRIADLEAALLRAESQPKAVPLSAPTQLPVPVPQEDPAARQEIAALQLRLREQASQLEAARASLENVQRERERLAAQLAAQAPKPAAPVVASTNSKDLEERLARSEAALKQQASLLEEYRAAFRTLESGGVKSVELAGIDPAAGKSSARAIYSAQGGLILFAKDLPKLPADKCYQLWILRKGTPAIVSGGLMRLDAQGRGFLRSPANAALQQATGFAITDEPLGGSVSARGRKLLFGAL